ncbi:hypothetical protein CC1G_01477 [Coprinopsis cinerea okayama7|uniref:Uncharacterized protein n=1 Tax=Coprinopsis cinerea (strain Okayama-7 / 130 / ATCC MYA-4618 / FGSC 9003) TaxID=240176 RepID=A8NYZ2_COPC7|nr:hypothetical protein CC1G_01477 [Coprinopsis cinerea okayama7\|eukprot:XP_001837565.2 hypothetical protein CC1G_01477 [Coprinopsis cinerea okayama7\
MGADRTVSRTRTLLGHSGPYPQHREQQSALPLLSSPLSSRRTSPRRSSSRQSTFVTPQLPNSIRSTVPSTSSTIIPGSRNGPPYPSTAPSYDQLRFSIPSHFITEEPEDWSKPKACASALPANPSPSPPEYETPSFRGLSPFLEKNDKFSHFVTRFLEEPTGYLVERITGPSNPGPPGLVARNTEGYTDIVEAIGVQVFRFSLTQPQVPQVVEVPYEVVHVFREFRNLPKSEIHSMYFVITSPFHFSMDTPCLWEYTSGGRFVREEHPICQKDWKFVVKAKRTGNGISNGNGNDNDNSNSNSNSNGKGDEKGKGKETEKPRKHEHRNKYRFNPVFLSLSDADMESPIRQTIYYWDSKPNGEVLSEAVIEYKFVDEGSSN